MIVRLLQQSDAQQIVEMGKELYKLSAYWHESKPLSAKKLTNAISTSLVVPDSYPCFVLDPGGDRLAGMMHLMVFPNYLNDEAWADEKVLYIRPEYRSLRTMRMLIKHVEQWCVESGVDHLEMSNASLKDERLGNLYKRMGYELSNICYAKRFSHG